MKTGLTTGGGILGAGRKGFGWKTGILFVALFWLLSGCGVEEKTAVISSVETARAQSARNEAPEAAMALASVLDEGDIEPAIPVVGEVSLGENEPDALNAEQLELISDYFFYYFQSLARLSAQDPSSLFAGDAAGQAQGYLHLVTFQVLTQIRAMQPEDLRLTGCSYQITIGEIVLRETGELMVYATEDNVQNFAYLPGVDAQTLNMGHAFYLAETDEGWRISRHWQNEDFHLLVSDQFLWDQPKKEGVTDLEASIRLLDEIREEILADAQKNMERRQGQLLQLANTVPEAANPYDRAAAVAYSDTWVGRRNPEWAYYDQYGGNCNNFASQVLLAGGIPMDVQGSIALQWKWYGEEVNPSQWAVGRSPSWAGVEEFYQYAELNSGYGLAADLSGSYFDGAPGDLLQFGVQGDWKHTAVIKEVVRDEDGNPVDYLINSNTADRRNYPAMAYPYTNHRLIRILGWNEE